MDKNLKYGGQDAILEDDKENASFSENNKIEKTEEVKEENENKVDNFIADSLKEEKAVEEDKEDMKEKSERKESLRPS